MTCNFTITHPSVVAIITVTHVHKETSGVSELRVLQNSRVSCKVMPRKRAETDLTILECRVEFECIVDLLRDRVYPVT